MNLIGITGNIGSGKDTVAKMIQYYYSERYLPFGFNIKDYDDSSISLTKLSGFKIKKFASKLKQIAAIILGCKAEDFELQEFKDKLLPNWLTDCNNKFIMITNRNLLQVLGTDTMRDNFHRNIWVESLFSDYDDNWTCGKTGGHPIKFPNWIISDVRFLNEAKAIKDRNGIIIKVYRGESTETHISETELNSIEYDYLIDNNGSIDDLYSKVCNILKTWTPE